MRVLGKVIGVIEAGDFLEVTVHVRVNQGVRQGAKADFKLYVAPHENEAYWVGRRVAINVTPLQAGK